MRFLALAALVAALTSAAPRAQQSPDPASFPFRNPDLPISERIDDLIGRLTLDEKVSLMIDRAAPIERLGIPAFPWWNEGLHGVARAGRATVFPQAIGLAATWDTDLMYRVATAISDEARAMNNRSVARGQRHIYQGLTFWSPNINIFRDPRWGRGQETYGEDPVLTGAMAVAFIKGMQGDDPRYLKTIATPKHFAVHSGPEPDRHTFDARPSEFDLRDTYLPAFRAAVVEGKAGSVVCAYNSFRGQPACGSDELLGKILRGEWGFTGYVVSDCGAVDDIHQTHKKVKTAEEAAVIALNAGTDVECGSGSWSPGSPDSFLTLADAVRHGRIKEDAINIALRRLFTAQMRLGIYDPPERVPYTRLRYEEVVNSPKHQALALEAAQKSIVLLKNEAHTLPLKKDLKSIAVIGPNANDVEVLLGNYNGTPFHAVTILEGIKALVGPTTKVLYARGAPLAEELPDLRPVPTEVLFSSAPENQTSENQPNLRNQGNQRNDRNQRNPRNDQHVPGLTGSYYHAAFSGPPVLTRVDRSVDFDWADAAPVPGLDPDGFSIRWTGEIKVLATGRYTLGFRGATMFRVLINDHIVAQGRSDHEPAFATGQVTLLAGQSYPIRIEYEHEKYDAVATLLWQPPGDRAKELQEERAEAVAAATSADAVVLALGLSSRLEGEEMSVKIEGFNRGDRTSLDLPSIQETLLEDVVRAAVGKPVILVLLSGSALSVNWANDHVPAILEAWYPGQAGGTAVADVLFGNVSPSGRLPITFYRSVDQLPPFNDYSMKGRTYRYFNGDPLFPFGYGVSYSRFAYSALKVPAKLQNGISLGVSVAVRNEGSTATAEVVTLYVTHNHPGARSPLRALRAFQLVTLESGQELLVTLSLAERDLSTVDSAGGRHIPPGSITVAVSPRQRGFAPPDRDRIAVIRLIRLCQIRS